VFGLKHNFWDITMNRHFNMFEPIPNMSPSFLAKDFENKTIVFFDCDIPFS
jgi:hypothetical protein